MPLCYLLENNMKYFPLPQIESCIPHRGTMRLVNRLIDVDDLVACAEVDINSDSFFANENGVPAWVGIEYMAQTVSAWAGAKALREGRELKLGFLLGTRRYESSLDIFPLGSCLVIKVRCEFRADNGLGQFHCEIFKNFILVAEAKITVYEPENGIEVQQETVL